MKIKEAKTAMIDWLEEHDAGHKKVKLPAARLDLLTSALLG